MCCPFLQGKNKAQKRASYFIITGLAERDKAFGAISHSAKGGRGWVYLTGDTHGELDRFERRGAAPGPARAIYVVVLGDFGFVWDGSKAEQKNLDWLRRRPYTDPFPRWKPREL